MSLWGPREVAVPGMFLSVTWSGSASLAKVEIQTQPRISHILDENHSAPASSGIVRQSTRKNSAPG